MSDPTPPPGTPPPPPPEPEPPPPEPEPSPQPYRLRTRDKVIAWSIGGALLVGFIAAGVAGSGDDEETEAGATTEATEPATTEREQETTEAPTTTAAPTTTTTAPPQPVVYEGVGTRVVEIELPDPEAVAMAKISHDGGSNFVVWELDAGLRQVQLLVNTIGSYNGTVAVNLTPGTVTSAFEIEADGAWRIEVSDLDAARELFAAEITGTGDDVVAYLGGAQVMSLHHEGASNFVVWFYGDDGTSDLLANEIGAYDATVPMPAGPALLVINADGTWRIGPG